MCIAWCCCWPRILPVATPALLGPSEFSRLVYGKVNLDRDALSGQVSPPCISATIPNEAFGWCVKISCWSARQLLGATDIEHTCRDHRKAADC